MNVRFAKELIAGVFVVAAAAASTSCGQQRSVTPPPQPAALSIASRATPSANYRVLHAFGGQQAPAGDVPYGYVIPNTAGDVFGTTTSGGGAGPTNQFAGVVYQIDPTGNETVLHKFAAGPIDGMTPWAGLVADQSGNLYGTTVSGGAVGFGCVFKIDTTEHETLLYSFRGQADGAFPVAALTLDSAGNLYGTTSGSAVFGFQSGDPYGKIFKIDANGNETVLHTFSQTGPGGYAANSGLIRDTAGNFYGTTLYGAAGFGTVYKLDTAGNETVLHTFTGPDGKWPDFGNLIEDAAGNLYGSAVNGGTSNFGVIFKVTPGGKYTVLYNFKGLTDGGQPSAPLVRDAAGNLYGTTPWGGGIGCGGREGCGTIFKIGVLGTKTILHRFASGSDGATPSDGLIADTHGNLYGVTQAGGNPSVQCSGITTGCGVVFELTPQ